MCWPFEKSAAGSLSAAMLFVWTLELDCARCQQIVYVSLSACDESCLEMVRKW